MLVSGIILKINFMQINYMIDRLLCTISTIIGWMEIDHQFGVGPDSFMVQIIG